jgi:hypothetical protein
MPLAATRVEGGAHADRADGSALGGGGAAVVVKAYGVDAMGDERAWRPPSNRGRRAGGLPRTRTQSEAPRRTIKVLAGEHESKTEKCFP